MKEPQGRTPCGGELLVPPARLARHHAVRWLGRVDSPDDESRREVWCTALHEFRTKLADDPVWARRLAGEVEEVMVGQSVVSVNRTT